MATSLAPLPLIRPITDLRTHLNDVCEQATESMEPVVLTKNGVASYGLMDSNAYDASQQRNRIYLALKEAELEEEYHPETVSGEKVRSKLDEIFALLDEDHA